jgi:uncharacterized protein (TIGR02453 family)
MIKPSTIKFLKDLKTNNNKAWFEEHRNAYIAAKEDFENFVQHLIDKLSEFDPDIKELEAKQCTFRQYRDVRFSKDKRPYKINMGAYMARGGKKSSFAGYYFHLEPGKSFMAGGLWMPMPPELKKVRQEVDYCFDEFKKIVNDKGFKKIYKDLEASEGVKLRTTPKGYDPENPAIEYLKLKSFLAESSLTDKELSSSTLLKTTVSAFKALKPFIDFLNRAIE